MPPALQYGIKRLTFPRLPMTPPVIRPAVPDDLRPLAAFVVRNNAQPAGQSLHCAAATPAELRAALRQTETFPDGWESSFVVAEDGGGEIVAACGWQFDAGRTHGWLWGPWVEAPSGWQTVAPALLDASLRQLPRSVRRAEAFLHAENRAGLRFLQSRGFSPGALTHVYVAPRTAWQPTADPADLFSPLRPAHEVGFARLHAETFPAGGSTPADDLLAGRDDQHVIFAAADGLRLLGYVCVSVNAAPREGFIEYLDVRPAARGRGIGRRLVRAALQWTFEQHRLPQAALCVSEWRGNARRLYEAAGFRLQASGVAARRSLS